MFNEFIDDVQDLLNTGYTLEQVSFLLNFKNKKQVHNLCYRDWKIARIKSTLYCVACGCELGRGQKLFCGHSCSASYTNTRRVCEFVPVVKPCGLCQCDVIVDPRTSVVRCTECRRIHTNKRLKQYYTGRPNKHCKRCDVVFVGHRKQYCDGCMYDYYRLYRPNCEFKFDVFKYSRWFDYSLIERHGVYSPSNKRNNLFGVSKDHMLSVRFGFDHGIDPTIIRHPANCELMLHNDNSSKNRSSSITLDELYIRIQKFESIYGSMSDW